MTTIRLTNTATRRKEAFEPIDPENVRMYVCGPTVYDRAHLGNARAVVVFDVLYRLLRHVYGEDHVTYVRNFTDVDDKINAKAAETGRPIREITDETIRWFHEDMDALGALRPTHEPRATEWIGPMVTMIEDLVAKDHAYEASGHVLFRVRSYAEYGALSGRSVDDMMSGARVEVAPFKEDPLDFVLWKPSTDDLPGWDSPWGRGRPGWHIECSAMARELLGGTFDIHGGGLDLQFPHHENEIAQSRCAHPGEGFAKVWMHNEMLQVEGKKMSKSLGNFFTVRQYMESYDEEFAIENIGPALRYRFLQTHYRSPMDLSKHQIESVVGKLGSWVTKARGIWEAAPISEERSRSLLHGTAFVMALMDDLNSALALTELEMLAEQALAPYPNNHLIGMQDDELHLHRFQAALELLGFTISELEELEPSRFFDRLRERRLQSDEEALSLIDLVVQRREDARADRDFGLADQIRQSLLSAGIALKDQPSGAAWTMTPAFSRTALMEVAKHLGAKVAT